MKFKLDFKVDNSGYTCSKCRHYKRSSINTARTGYCLLQSHPILIGGNTKCCQKAEKLTSTR